MPLGDAIAILVKGDVQLPVENVFDAPMATQGGPILFGAHETAADEEADFGAFFVFHNPVRYTHADDFQVRPQFALAKSCWILNDGIGACFEAAVAAVDGGIFIPVEPGEIGFVGLDKAVAECHCAASVDCL